MIYSSKAGSVSNHVFHVSGRMIWFSALFMGVLASIPKILQLHITVGELAIDASIFNAILAVEHYFARKLCVQLKVATSEKLLVGKDKATQFLTWLDKR